MSADAERLQAQVDAVRALAMEWARWNHRPMLAADAAAEVIAALGEAE